MNLGFDAWIPVLFRDGTQGEVSLADAFARGREIADLAARPHERIAVMRLLVCVAQAALDGPDEEGDWPEAEARAQAAVAEYLSKWRERFELFGDGPRFLQARRQEMSEFEISKLVFHRACGNNTTLFDQAGGSQRSLSPAAMARALVAFQNYSAPIGAGYTGKPPCLDRHFLQTWLIGENLLASVLANGVDHQSAESHCPAGFGRPIWESDIDFEDEGFVRNLTLSWLGRLAPVTRGVWLSADGRTFEMAKPGIKHPTYEEYREAAATVLSVEKKTGEERYLLAARLDRQPWRDLQSVLRPLTESGAGRPLPLQRGEPVFRKLWFGALLTDGKAKYEDCVEAVYSVPRELLSEAHRMVYADGVEWAGRCAVTLRKAVAEYGQDLKAETDPGGAERHFWQELDQRVEELFGVVRVYGTDEFPTQDQGWRRGCAAAALAAYRFACPSETPRQLQAFAKGLRRLRLGTNQSKQKEAK